MHETCLLRRRVCCAGAVVRSWASDVHFSGFDPLVDICVYSLKYECSVLCLRWTRFMRFTYLWGVSITVAAIALCLQCTHHNACQCCWLWCGWLNPTCLVVDQPEGVTTATLSSNHTCYYFLSIYAATSTKFEEG